MSPKAIDHDRLTQVMSRLGDAVVDPLLWPELMESICAAVGASAALLLQSDVRTPDVPRTKSIDEGTRFYFANDWQTKDPRAIGFPRMMAGEVVTDHDLLTPEQIRADPMYNEVLFPLKSCFRSASNGLPASVFGPTPPPGHSRFSAPKTRSRLTRRTSGRLPVLRQD
ncbi:hypothetical protein [Bradyrhizobium sp. 2S1]|uniref:hypothetical protein n=1 Tax=Bradyrhizobium sp. 2S1 TaxID=1404429 RepID=UPI001408E47F|nr:hypothetical protein [Bradyrhizobium sp. 2S1]MCK7673527.1 hypothetical protein [Bradyrhizobium sp. 2S1]